jgi:hypothetical protein
MSGKSGADIKQLEQQALAYAGEIDSDYLKDGLEQCPNCRGMLVGVLASPKYLRMSSQAKTEFLNSLWGEEPEGEEGFDDSRFYDPKSHLP